MLELPELGLPDLDVAWRATIELLGKATLKYQRGEYEEVLQDVRKVLEGVLTVLGSQWEIPQRKGEAVAAWTQQLEGRIGKAWSEDIDLASILFTMIRSMWPWLCSPHHYASRLPRREEARFALGSGAELVTLAVRLLSAHPQPLKPPDVTPMPKDTAAQEGDSGESA